MAIYLTTGKPGSYKTASLMEEAQKIISEGRLVVFCNFRGLQAEKNAFTVMEHFRDWIKFPEGTCFFIDEIQEFTRDVPTAAKTEDLPKWFTALEKHRHEGYDFYVSTQHPMFVHTHLRRLVEKHFHMQRAQGLPFANRRMWQQICNEPEDLKNASLKMGCTTTIYRPSKKVFNFYESTVLDTHKFKLPTKFLRYFAIIGGLVGLAIFVGKPVFDKYIHVSDPKTSPAANNNTNSNGKQITEQEALELARKEQKDREQAAQMGLTYEQFKDLKNPQIVNQQLAEQNPQVEVAYDPNRPYEAKLVNYKYQATSVPRFSGCIKYGSRYVAYSEQGTILENVSQSDCRRLLENGDRPYNYFGNSNPSGVRGASASTYTGSSMADSPSYNNDLSNSSGSSNVGVSEDKIRLELMKEQQLRDRIKSESSVGSSSEPKSSSMLGASYG